MPDTDDTTGSASAAAEDVADSVVRANRRAQPLTDAEFLARADAEITPVFDFLPPLDLTGDIPTARAAADAARAPLIAALPEIPGVSTRDVDVPGRATEAGRNPDTWARIYEPDGGHDGSALFYIHGGGMVLMKVEDTDFLCKRLAVDAGCLVVAVEYRLAPEHPYPAALDDCAAGLDWLFANAEAIGVDPGRVAVGGSSAGGGLAAATVLRRAREGREREGRERASRVGGAGAGPGDSLAQPCFQWLLYPMLDDRNDTPSSHEIVHPNVWNRTSNLAAWAAYLGGRDADDLAAPARATVDDLRGLPPAYVDVGELDLFRDENIAYAAALLQAGVPTELLVTPGAFHASETYVPGAPSSRRINAARLDALRRGLAAHRP